ncbi:hypothetical protein GPECTOR_49g538 [Gonium pectorale]|uniref:C-type lectin domain-containing protein n=1 Tax=Gonium pectorale TaxID=33097 RepID=A0A150G7Z2_GONPE|nr:hypothetical protein GPECTOR_49g538 [Gonium pectorale]|eukprot:KXZ45954.1 hypothetical protein GPECTOR_49g538 [Gonium pectorale]
MFTDVTLRGNYDEATAVCESLGMALVDNVELLRTMCAVERRTTCWVNRTPRTASNGERLCGIMVQEQRVDWQLCDQAVGFVCGPKAGGPAPVPVPAPGHGPAPAPSPAQQYLVPEWERLNFDQAVDLCSRFGGHLESDEALVASRCKAAATTCWLNRPTVVASNGERLCAMVDQKGVTHWQLCSQSLQFVCTMGWSAGGGRTGGSPGGPQCAQRRLDAPHPDNVRFPYLVNGADGAIYVFVPATGSYQDAAAACASRGGSLVSYDRNTPDAPATKAISQLCLARKTTCWAGNPTHPPRAHP